MAAPSATDKEALITSSSWCPDNRDRKLELHTVTMLPPGNTIPVGVVIFHHGFTDHSGRHVPVLAPLAKAGFVILAYDARGHGMSGPSSAWMRSYIWDFNDLVRDLVEFIHYARKRFSELPIFVMGHSMGGAISALAAVRRPDLISGVILSSPLVRLIAAPHSVKMRIAMALIAALNWLVPGLTYARVFSRQPVGRGMNDPIAVKDMKTDPFWDPLPHRFGSVCALLQGTRLMTEEVPIGLRGIPVYIQQGTADVATKCEYLKELLASSGLGPLYPPGGSSNQRHQPHDGKRVTYFEVSGGFHDLNHDLATPECLRHIVTWLCDQV